MDEVVRIAVETDPQRLHAAVAGWEEHVTDWNGLAWIAGRFGIAASSDASAAATAPASWYPDPWRPGGLRWWDGIQWTHQATPDVGRGWRARPPKAPPPTFPPSLVCGLSAESWRDTSSDSR